MKKFIFWSKYPEKLKRILNEMQTEIDYLGKFGELKDLNLKTLQELANRIEHIFKNNDYYLYTKKCSENNKQITQRINDYGRELVTKKIQTCDALEDYNVSESIFLPDKDSTGIIGKDLVSVLSLDAFKYKIRQNLLESAIKRVPNDDNYNNNKHWNNAVRVFNEIGYKLYECVKARKKYDDECIPPNTKDVGHQYYIKQLENKLKALQEIQQEYEDISWSFNNVAGVEA